jgi:hypothetical protein
VTLGGWVAPANWLVVQAALVAKIPGNLNAKWENFEEFSAFELLIK